MPYTFSLSAPKSRDFAWHSLKAEVLELTPLSDQELIFGDQNITDPIVPILFLIRNDRETNRQYWDYLKGKDRAGLLRRIFNIIDPERALEFYYSHEATVTVLTVYTDIANSVQFSKVVRQLKYLARKYDLSFFDPQIAKNVEISPDNEDLKYCD